MTIKQKQQIAILNDNVLKSLNLNIENRSPVYINNSNIAIAIYHFLYYNQCDKSNNTKRIRGRNGQPSPLLEMWDMSPHLISFNIVADSASYPLF